MELLRYGARLRVLGEMRDRMRLVERAESITRGLADARLLVAHTRGHERDERRAEGKILLRAGTGRVDQRLADLLVRIERALLEGLDEIGGEERLRDEDGRRLLDGRKADVWRDVVEAADESDIEELGEERRDW